MTWNLGFRDCCGCVIFEDDFDRADDTDIGTDWTEGSGDWEIVSNRLQAKGGTDDQVCTADATNGTYPVYLSVKAIARAWGDQLRLFTNGGTVYIEIAPLETTGTGWVKLVTTTGEVSAQVDLTLDTEYTLTLCIVEFNGGYYVVATAAGETLYRATAYTSSSSGVATGVLDDIADFDDYSYRKTVSQLDECQDCANPCYEECVADSGWFGVPDSPSRWATSGWDATYDYTGLNCPTLGDVDNNNDAAEVYRYFRINATTSVTISLSVDGCAYNPETSAGAGALATLTGICVDGEWDGSDSGDVVIFDVSAPESDPVYCPAMPEYPPCVESICDGNQCDTVSASDSLTLTLPPGLYKIAYSVSGGCLCCCCEGDFEYDLDAGFWHCVGTEEGLEFCPGTACDTNFDPPIPALATVGGNNHYPPLSATFTLTGDMEEATECEGGLAMLTQDETWTA